MSSSSNQTISEIETENEIYLDELHEFDSKDNQFQPYESSLICPDCKHHIILLYQPIHLNIEIFCPKCLHDLTQDIREHIINHAFVD